MRRRKNTKQNSQMNYSFPIETLKVNFKPKTINQSKYLKCIDENTITLCHGCPGTGKSFLATASALFYLKHKKVDKILFTRPMVQCGKGLGFLKGDLNEKFMPYVKPVMDEMINLVGNNTAHFLIQEGYVEIAPLELMRGMNYHNTFMILDECQNTDIGQMKMFLTRIGQNSKCVLTGDTNQTDLISCDYLKVIQKLNGVEDIDHCELFEDDIIRNKLIKDIILRLP